MWTEEENHSLLVFGVIFFQSPFLFFFSNFKKCTITYLIPGEFYISKNKDMKRNHSTSFNKQLDTIG